MGFSEYLGNQRIVTALRGMLAGGRVPHAMLFSGTRGVGRFTLARMFAQAANCERLKDDFCGECDSCRRISQLAEPRRLIEQGLVQRGERPDAATVERMPLLLQTHPDVWAAVPDPVRLKDPVVRPVLHVGQLRAIQRAAYFKPEARRRVFIVAGAETMRWDLAPIFLKILEEPPESATLILIAPGPFDVLPTIRSRCLQFRFAPLQAAEVEKILSAKTEMSAANRRLAAQLSEGSPGAAMQMDVRTALALRREALAVLSASIGPQGVSDLFARTSALAKNPDVAFEYILEVFYSLLTDVLDLSCSSSLPALRNPALRRELEVLSRKLDPAWIRKAVEGFDTLHARLRRNVNRPLGLDAVCISLASLVPDRGAPR